MEIKYDLVLITLPDRISAQPEMYFPLGISYLASVVSKADFKVKICDFRREIGEIPKAKYYGFSCATPQIEEAKYIAKQVDGITIVGGAHPSLMPESCKGYFDYIIQYEGEDIILQILSGKVVKGIWRTSRISNLDRIPYPAWDMIEHPFSYSLFPGERYGMGELAGTIIGSRGCSYACHFCGNVYRTPVVYRSKENIIDELKEMIKRGVRYFRFEDDNFTIHPEFIMLCLEMGKLDIRYKCHTRSNLLNKDLALKMYSSGCEECGIGVESADDNVLKIVNKKEIAEEHGEAIKILRETGIRSKTYFMSGLPGETDETLRLNMEFMKRYKPDKWTISTFSPYPGCDIYNNPDKYETQIIGRNWDRWGNFCKGSYNHIIKGQSPNEMWDRYQKMYAYFRSNEWQQ